MSALASVAESRIQEALEAGDDRGLVGQGKPLDMDAYFAAPGSLRAGFGLLKSAGVTPPEVDAMRLVHELREALAACPCPEVGTADATVMARRKALLTELRLREVELAMAMERMSRTLRLDAAAS